MKEKNDIIKQLGIDNSELAHEIEVGLEENNTLVIEMDNYKSRKEEHVSVLLNNI